MRRLLFGSSLLRERRLANIAWTLFRLHIGLSIALGAGFAKVVHKGDAALPWTWSNTRFGVGSWFVTQVANLGFTSPNPEFWALAAAWGELIGGLGIACGLLTRWNGLQLAVQFYVVAFLWYKSPEPIVGMYYQQLLFWGFVLVMVLGGGRYSLDRLILPATTGPAPVEPEPSPQLPT